jgi:hypothetical protein
MEDIKELIAQQRIRTKRLTELHFQLKELIQNDENCHEVFKQQVETWRVFHDTHNELLAIKKLNSSLESNQYFVNDEYKATNCTTTKIMSDLMDYQATCSEKLQKMLTNLKKDSEVRKTKEYLTSGHNGINKP